MKFVKDSCDSFQVEGMGYYVIKEKLKMLKEKLRWWNMEVFRSKDLQIENIVRDLNEVMVADGGLQMLNKGSC